MRLIDADALSRALAEMWYDSHISVTGVSVSELINKQPTIEPKTKVIAPITFDEDKLREIVHEAVERIKEEYDIVDRPKGEWIFRREFVEDTPFTGYRCSNCNYWQGMGAWNFCPNCGSDNRGEDNE